MCVMGSTNDRASGYAFQNNAPLAERVHASRQRVSQHALAPQFIYPGIRPRTRGRAT
jgi:hypothetical protein